MPFVEGTRVNGLVIEVELTASAAAPRHISYPCRARDGSACISWEHSMAPSECADNGSQSAQTIDSAAGYGNSRHGGTRAITAGTCGGFGNGLIGGPERGVLMSYSCGTVEMRGASA